MLRRMFFSTRTPGSAPGGTGTAGTAESRRAAERHPTETITCALGDVVDLSRSGMRLASKSKPPMQPGREAQIRLVFPKGSILVTVQARWLKRKGLRRYEMGFQFVNLTPAAEEALESVAKFGFVVKSKKDGGAEEEKAQRPRVTASVQLPDYYAVLGVERGASEQEIHAAYRRMARAYHPDLNKAPEAEAQFMRLREAYDVLTDVEQRTSYDNRASV